MSAATKIKIVANPRYQRSGTKSYVHMMRKYRFNPTKPGPYFLGKTLHQTGRQYTDKPVGGRVHMQELLQKKSVDTEQAGEVPAEDVQNDAMYLAQVGIGTPAQTLNLDFDTGSADLWVWSTNLPSATLSANSDANHTVFDSSKSSTFKNQEGSTWEISYGDGSSASGSVGTDSVNIGGVVVKNQAVELADKMSAQFASGAGDGLLGLAFSSINTVKPKSVATPVQNMIAQSDITSGLFTAKLGSWRDADEPDKGDSFYTFGFIDQDTVTAAGADITYTAVDNSNGFWMFDSTSATVNGKSITRSGNTAIADTGTTLALVDDATCKAIYDAIEGAIYDNDSQGYIYPSNTTADNLPTVSFAVGNKQFAVQKEDLAFAEAKTGYVYGGIQSRGSMTFDILGDTFLKGIYAVFDVGNTRFGAVQRKELNQNLATPPAE